jgi:hypothetical protein
MWMSVGGVPGGAEEASAHWTRLGDGSGPRLDPQAWAYFSSLPDDTPVRVDATAKEPKGVTPPSKSCIRMRQYGQATTIGQLRTLHPDQKLFNDDMKNDLHKGHILIPLPTRKAVSVHAVTRLLNNKPWVKNTPCGADSLTVETKIYQHERALHT